MNELEALTNSSTKYRMIYLDLAFELTQSYAQQLTTLKAVLTAKYVLNLKRIEV